MPSHCAAAGAVPNAASMSTASARFIRPPLRTKSTGPGRRPPQPLAYGRNPRPASQSCVALMHPHGADRHALVIAQAGAEARIEEANLEPEVEPTARHAVRALDRGAAAVGEAQQQADLGALEGAIGSVERRRARRLRGRARRAGEQTGEDQQREVTPHAAFSLCGSGGTRRRTEYPDRRTAFPG